MESDVFISEVKKNSSEEELSSAIRNIFLKSTDNLSWLSKGDKVLLKPALNSGDPYPATTDPLTLKVIADILKEKGAEVIVADQSGIEHVLQDETGIKNGSSADCFEKSGMKKSGLEFTPIESLGWDGFYNFNSDKTSSWKNGFYITKLIKEVNHIINLPRISTHGQAGLTLGFKNMVGLLRDDSRIEFHRNGPLCSFVKNAIRDSSLEKIENDNSKKFFEKITEISLAVKDKLRLTFFTGTKVQLTLGPDKHPLRTAKKCFESYSVEPDTGLIFASSNQVAAEAVAIAFAESLYPNVPFSRKLIQKLLIILNGRINELGKESVWQNPFIRHAIDLELGSNSLKLNFSNVSKEMQDKLDKLLKPQELNSAD